MATITTPDWLTRHHCDLQAGVAGHTWFVLLRGEPNYELKVRPAAGKFACEVVQTINGRRLDSKTTFATEEDALRGGLEDLRKALGW